MGLHFDPTSRVIHSAQKNLGQMYNPQNNLIWGLFRTKRLEYSFYEAIYTLLKVN